MLGLGWLKKDKSVAIKKGLPPGSLVFVGDEKDFTPVITVFDYSSEFCDEKTMAHIDECKRFRDKSTVSWVNIDGVHEVDLIREIGVLCNLHPLLLEDVLNTQHRSKIEELDDHLFMVCKMLRYDEAEQRIMAEQVSVVLGEHFVLSFQESLEDVFGAERDRLRRGKGRLRKMGADYLVCCLLNAMLDEYMVVIESVGDQLEALEDEVIFNPEEQTVQKIYTLKKDLIYVHKEARGMRGVVSGLLKGESELISEFSLPFYRDLYDHILHVIETVDTYRDILAGLLDTYLTSISNRMNQVMRVLTVIATVFIPITFIAGVYGMNFEVMPELRWAWGYPAALGVMLVTALALLLYFKRKYWF